jgi:hypothetical protein
VSSGHGALVENYQTLGTAGRPRAVWSGAPIPSREPPGRLRRASTSSAMRMRARRCDGCPRIKALRPALKIAFERVVRYVNDLGGVARERLADRDTAFCNRSD